MFIWEARIDLEADDHQLKLVTDVNQERPLACETRFQTWLKQNNKSSALFSSSSL